MSMWSSKKLREVIGRPISGSRPAGGVNTETEGIPSLGGENVLSEGGVTFENLNRVPAAFFKSMPKGRLQPLDVLINKDGAQTGKVGLYKGNFPEACVNEHLFILRNINGGIDQRFLFYSALLPDTQAKIARRITGSAQPGLNTTFVDAVDILVPPSSHEQERIAEILSTLDEAIEQTETLIAKYQQIKAGLMHDLFTRGVTPDGRLRPAHAPHLYKESPLGWIPKEWEVKALRQVATYQHGRPFPSTDYSDEGVLLLRPGNLHVSGIVRFDAAHTTRVPERWLRECPEFVLKQQDIVMNLTAQSLEDQFLGRVCIVRNAELSLLNQRIARFFPRQTDHHFLYWLLRSLQFRNQIDRTTQGTKVQHIYNTDLNRIVFAVPSSPQEQEHIAALLLTVTESLLASKSSVEKLRQQKHGLMHDLLTGRVRVKVAEATSA